MFTGFTLSGTSLKLLKVGERGVIARFTESDPTLLQKLSSIGLSPGTPITLEQRFPRFVVRTRNQQLTLDHAMIQAIYVRTRAS